MLSIVFFTLSLSFGFPVDAIARRLLLAREGGVRSLILSNETSPSALLFKRFSFAFRPSSRRAKSVLDIAKGNQGRMGAETGPRRCRKTAGCDAQTGDLTAWGQRPASPIRPRAAA